MWDNRDVKSETHKRTIDNPERYGFIDLSQNSQTPGPDNWKNAQYIFDYIKHNRRPVNSTKIYGVDTGPWINRGITTKHAVNTFFRNILGGFASSRFHRPPSGLGLSEISIKCIETVRKIEGKVKIRDLRPAMDLIEPGDETEIYLSANEGESYVIYFTGPGKARLDLTQYDNSFRIKWINIVDAEWGKEEKIKGGDYIDIENVIQGGALAVLQRK